MNYDTLNWEKVLAFQRKKGWNRGRLARELKISPSHLSLLLSGSRWASLDVCLRFVRLLELPFEELFEVRPEPLEIEPLVKLYHRIRRDRDGDAG